VIYGAMTLFGVWLIVVDRIGPGVILIVAAVLGALASAFARRRGSGDLERVNALEFADERDRAAAGKALATVGVAALLASMAQFVVAIIVDDPLFSLMSAAVLLFLAIVWLVANWYFVRRG
jgi:Na+/citrate or Na+/malate symporter